MTLALYKRFTKICKFKAIGIGDAKCPRRCWCSAVLGVGSISIVVQLMEICKSTRLAALQLAPHRLPKVNLVPAIASVWMMLIRKMSALFELSRLESKGVVLKEYLPTHPFFGQFAKLLHLFMIILHRSLQNTMTSGNFLGFPAIPAIFRENINEKQPTFTLIKSSATFLPKFWKFHWTFAKWCEFNDCKN